MTDLRVRIDEIITTSMEERPMSGVVGVNRGSDVVVTRAAGLADRRHLVPITPRTRMSIASGTKGATALTVMSRVADGTLSLDTTARSLLGDDLALKRRAGRGGTPPRSPPPWPTPAAGTVNTMRAATS